MRRFGVQVLPTTMLKPSPFHRFLHQQCCQVALGIILLFIGGFTHAQLRPVVVEGTEQAETQAATALNTDAVDLTPTIRPVIVARDWGVLFKVTPPAAALQLPAENMAEHEGPPVIPVPPVVSAKASYLLGTIHFGTPAEQGINYDTLLPLLAATDAFVNEADTSSQWDATYDHYRWLPLETSLGSMIGDEQMALAHALLPALRMQDLQRMKPWAVLSLLEARGESVSDTTMDARLQQAAVDLSKPKIHLETLEQQLQALDCVPANEQAHVLGERLRASWVMRIETAEAMAFYRSRNLDAWMASIDRMEGLSDSAKAIEHRARVCLLEERTNRWIGPLETLFQDTSSFVAVGAMHLVGANGLIAQLRRDGFLVEVVPH